jgi:nickel-type superoxide dismutase maturation protease
MQPRQLWKNRRLTATNGGSSGRFALVALALLLGIAAALRFMPLRLSRFVVVGSSMKPTLEAGDRLLVLRGSVALLRLRPGTVVLARSPAASGLEVVKRIAGIASDQRRSEYVLLGDNPVASTDSRHFGPLPATAITGRVIYRYWPDHRRGTIP